MNPFCVPWVEAAQASLGVVGSFLVAFGVSPFTSINGELLFDTSKPAVKDWKFGLGLAMIFLAGTPPVVKYFWTVCSG